MCCVICGAGSEKFSGQVGDALEKGFCWEGYSPCISPSFPEAKPLNKRAEKKINSDGKFICSIVGSQNTPYKGYR